MACNRIAEAHLVCPAVVQTPYHAYRAGWGLLSLSLVAASTGDVRLFSSLSVDHVLSLYSLFLLV